jgi:hypothetical protein
VQDINPSYPYPHALASTLLETSRKQLFFAQHLPSLADASGPAEVQILSFIEHLAFSALA